MKKFICFMIVLLMTFLFIYSDVENLKSDKYQPKIDKTDEIKSNKLIGPLKEAVKIYREFPKLTCLNIARYRINKFEALGKKSEMLTKEEMESLIFTYPTLKNQGKKGLEKKSDFLINALIHPEIQKRWKNPPYDVLRCNIEVKGNPYNLENSYLKIRSVSRIGNKTIANIEVAGIEIENVAEKNSVIRIEPIFKNKTNNDIATVVTGVARIRNGLFNNIYTKGYTGSGVITGIIDTGIDWSHEDFIDPLTNTTRILYIWDTEDSTGPTPSSVFGGSLSSLTYGTVWTKNDIDDGMCTSIDSYGHGTHVAGSVSGNGYATGRYTGMAPNADIIIVKGLDNNGILFIYEIAASLGQPCVVNMSYGPDYPLLYISYWPEPWPADGTSLRAQMIDGWNSTYGPGCIPIKAAGNEGHWNTYSDLSGGNYPYMVGGYHSQASLAGLASSTHYMEVPDYAALWNGWGLGTPTASDCPYILIGMWYEQPVQITIISPNGHTIGPMIHGNTGSAPTTGDGWCYFNLSNTTAAANGFFYGVLQLLYNTDPATEPAPGTWEIQVDPIPNGSIASPMIDIWVNDIRYIGGFFGISWYPSRVKFNGQNTHSNYIIDEGASPFLLCVGSWTTRNTWTDIDGNQNTNFTQSWLNDITYFSSPGPSRDRRIKPDIAAPGDIIVSSLSKDAGWTNEYLVDSRHGVYSGTSMSTAQVSGGVALILEKYPNQDVAGIRNLISGWALHDSFTNQRGENAFGYGKFNVLALNDPPVAIIKKDKDQISLDNPEKTVVFDGSDSYDPETFPLSYRFALETEIITSYSRSKIKANNLNYSFVENGSTATLEPDPYAEVIYKVTLVVNDTIADSSRAVTTIEARYFPLYPPSNVFLEKIENNLIFYMEYINRLGWQHNPANKGEIKNYRIYRKEKGQIDDFYQLLASVEGDVLSFDDRGLSMDGFYTYKIISVNYGDKESAPVVVSN